MNDLLREQRSIQVDELIVVDEEENDVGLLDRSFGLGQGHVVTGLQLSRKLFDVRLDG